MNKTRWRIRILTGAMFFTFGVLSLMTRGAFGADDQGVRVIQIVGAPESCAEGGIITLRVVIEAYTSNSIGVTLYEDDAFKDDKIETKVCKHPGGGLQVWSGFVEFTFRPASHGKAEVGNFEFYAEAAGARSSIVKVKKK